MKSAACPIAAAVPETAASWVDRALFWALLALLGARPLLSETFEPLQVSFLTALEVSGGPTPATTAVLDSLLLAAAACALARTRRGWGGAIALGVTLLTMAVIVSSCVAGERTLALLAGADLVALVLGGAALVRLARARWMATLLVAVLLATGITTAIKCVSQALYENPQTRARWETVYKPALLRQGFDPQDPLFINFERRMQAGEAYGFLGHPNITASGLMMWLLATGGVLGGALGRRPLRSVAGPAVASAVLCASVAGALWLTGSRGAAVAAAGGVLLLLCLGMCAAWVARHARAVLLVALAGYAALVGAGVAYGLQRGTLPGASLAFRWYYWTAAARAIQDVPLTGLGRENFAEAYTRYKPAESTEEVRNPHNLWVGLLVELGPLGLVAGIVLCAGVVLASMRALAPPATDQPAAGGVTAGRCVPVVASVLLVQAVASATPFGAPGVALVWGQEIAAVWTLALLVALWLLDVVTRAPNGRAWLVAGLCAALLAALVHGLVDFALLTPAGLAVGVLCAAGAVTLGGARTAAAVPVESARTWRGPVPWLLVGGMTVAHVLFVVCPSVATVSALNALDAALRSGRADAIPAAAARAAAVPGGGSTAARSAARAMLQLSHAAPPEIGRRQEWARQAQEYAQIACARNPRDHTSQAVLAGIHEELGRLYGESGARQGSLDAWSEAAAAWERAVSLYPTSPRLRISAGKAWLAVGRATGTALAAERARGHFREALRIDDLWPSYEVMRLRPAEREATQRLLDEPGPESASDTRPTTANTDPATE